MKTIFVTSQVCLLQLSTGLYHATHVHGQNHQIDLFPTKARVRKIYQQDLLFPELLLFLVYIQNSTFNVKSRNRQNNNYSNDNDDSDSSAKPGPASRDIFTKFPADA